MRRPCVSCGLARWKPEDIPDEAVFCVRCDADGARREKMIGVLELLDAPSVVEE